MPVINLITEISAPVDVVFDLSRNIDLHKISTAHTSEEAVAGCTSGLIGMGESVTWRAKHLGFVQHLTTKITAFKSPYHFTHEMVSGAFHSFKHEHIFTEENGLTVMEDIFTYKNPYGVLGRLADVLFLKKYMSNLLSGRNAVIKRYAESQEPFM